MIDSRDEEIFALCREIGELKEKVRILSDIVTRQTKRANDATLEVKRLNEIIRINHIGPGKGSR